MMPTSAVKVRNGRVELWVNGVREPAMAYITYFEENGRYDDFAKAGYTIFSANASFTGLPSNPRSLFAANGSTEAHLNFCLWQKCKSSPVARTK